MQKDRCAGEYQHYQAGMLLGHGRHAERQGCRRITVLPSRNASREWQTRHAERLVYRRITVHVFPSNNASREWQTRHAERLVCRRITVHVFPNSNASRGWQTCRKIGVQENYCIAKQECF